MEWTSSTCRVVRNGLRRLRGAPLHSVVVILAMAFAVGLPTDQFAVGRSLRGPLPFPGGEKIVVPLRRAETGGLTPGVTLEELEEWRGSLTSFEDLAAYRLRTVTLGDGREVPFASVPAAHLSDNGMTLLGVDAPLGRPLLPGDGRPGAESVAVLGYRLWQEHFGEDTAVVGRRVLVDGVPATVIGVMPEGFGFPRRQQLWLPLADGGTPQASVEAGGDAVNARVVGIAFGRLRPEVSREGARAEFRARVPSAARVELFTRVGESLQDRLILLTFDAGLALIVLVVVGNVGTLVLSRSLAGIRGVGIRRALGATRARVVGYLLGETILLAVPAWVLGLSGAWWALVRFNSAQQSPPFWAEPELNGESLLFSLGLALLALLAIALPQALKVTRGNLETVLREGAGATRGVKFGTTNSLLLAVQCLLSVGLLGGSLGLVGGLGSDRGHSAEGSLDGILVAEMAFRPGLAPGDPGPPATAAEEEEVLREIRDLIREAVRARPGIEEAAWASAFPGEAVFRQARLFREGEDPRVEGEDKGLARVVEVGEGFFRTLGMAVLDGRAFGPEDREPGSAPAILSQRLATEVFGGARAAGQRVRIRDSGTEEGSRELTVVGVVADDPTEGEVSLGGGYLYRPLAESRYLRLGVRSRMGTAQAHQALFAVVRELGVPVQVRSGTSIRELLGERERVLRIMGTWTFGIGGLALLMTLICLYALMSFAVTSRTQEVGIRLCLGASRKAILWEVMGRGLRLMALGSGLGVLLGLGVSRLTGILPYDLQPTGPGVLATVAGIMMAVGALATLGPVRRLLTMDGMEVIRVGGRE